MTIIWPCGLSVEEYAAAGKGVVVPRPCCSACGAAMVFWSGYSRSVRSGAVFRIWVKRCRCGSCRCSDAMLPSFCLVGRLDAVEVIGASVQKMAAGWGARRVAVGIGELFAYTTVRGWWRRHRERAVWLLGLVGTALAWCLPDPSGAADTDALVALESWGAAVPVVAGVGLWAAVSLVAGGAWLSTTTDTPTTGGCGCSWMAVMACRKAQFPP